MPQKTPNPAAFRRAVWKYYRKEGRHNLPWRKTKDTYKILVSEIMLQQTQVERVEPYYRAFLTKFPTVHALASAPLSSVLKSWQGLGYNRRAKMLHEAAKVVVREYKGKLPKTPEELEALPGIGHYTARAIAAFAHNEDVIFIETNIRTVLTHEFFAQKQKVDDKVLVKLLEELHPKGKSREWYAALMDYGAYLKRNGVRINAKQKGYVKQSAFKGSAREARGAILKELAQGPASAARLHGLLGDSRTEQLRKQIQALAREGFITKRRERYALAS